MKWYKYICLVILAAVCVIACKKEEEDPIPVPPTYEATGQTISTTYKLADIHWEINTTVTINEMWIEYGTDSTFAKCEKSEMSVTVDHETGITYCGVALAGLTENTLYYGRFRVVNKTGSAVLNTFTFKTKAYEVPQIRLDSVTELEETWCKVHATLMEWGMDTMPHEIGFCFAAHKDVSIEDTAIVAFENPDEPDYAFYWNVLQYLKDSTTYYVRAYAKNTVGVGYSEEVSFTTKPFSPPTLAPVEISEVSYTSANVSSYIVHDGGLGIPETGFFYSFEKDPVKYGTRVTNTYGEFHNTLNGLMQNTTYYVCAYAVNDRGFGYSEVASFKTVEYGMPVVTTDEVTTITTNSAYGGGNVMEDGGDEITDRGLCYGLKANPSLEDNVVQCGSGLGHFGYQFTGLEEGTTYHVRAYATNSRGTTFGEDKTFTTDILLPPTVVTLQVSFVDYTYAQSGGNVTADGGMDVTERGLCYATTPNPTIRNTKAIDSQIGLGDYYLYMNNLQPGTTYYVRAYATNEKGTGYGDELTFTTLAYEPPTVGSIEVSSVEKTNATVCANVSADGGLPVTQRGFCYSTWQQNPRPDGEQNVTVTDDGTGTGSYCALLTNLNVGFKYYVCAFATNSEGTTYSQSVTFTTLTSDVPTVYTKPVTNITTTSATTGGNVTYAGSSLVTERGICYATYSNPSVSDNVLTTTPGDGDFTVNMSQLMYNTTYYVRAYAINDQGIGYGEEISFTTEDYGTRSTITYYASAKLTETEDANLAGLHTNAFDVPVIGHEFSNGVGVITFGGQVTRIGASAFKKCALMTKIDIPGAIIAIGDYAFYGCTWLQEVSLGNVKAVGRSAFEDCTNLATLICSQDMTVVSAYMCKGCTSLTIAAMYSGIKTIDQGAFENCGLEFVNIPATVNTIGLSAFYGNNLTSISCSAPSPPACQANTFSSFTAKLYVPAASVTAYSNADVWWNFAPNIFPLQE